MTRCIGFGEFTDKCDNEAGSSHSDRWCQRCDDLRRKHIDTKFDEVIEEFKRMKYEYPGDPSK